MDTCFEVESMKQAWNDWLASGNQYAQKDIEMMRTENGKYFNLVAIKATKISAG
jgi:hypothetical protein